MVLKRACGERAHASGSIGLEAIAVTARVMWFGSHGAGRMDRWQDRSHSYGVRFTDLRVFSELPSLYPEAEGQAKQLVCKPSRSRSETLCPMDFPRELARECRAG